MKRARQRGSGASTLLGLRMSARSITGPYLVMEYLEGEDLSQLVQQHGQQDIGAAAEYIRQACEAIEEAHTQGIVHRDLKPSNLFLTRRPNGQPCIKVLDFGISKLTSATSASGMQMTNTSAVFGSPMYIAPEQMRSARAVDHRADIWSLGATLYELVTGRVPFEGESLTAACPRPGLPSPSACGAVSIEQRRVALRLDWVSHE